MKKPIPFGKYLLLDRINVGGMAEVFFAKVFGDDGATRILAIKKILPTMVEDEEFITMFIDEARIAVQLDHPNVVQIFELGKLEENYYIAMEYLPGRDLRALLDRAKKRKETVALEQSLYLAAELAHGLDYAHRAKDAQGNDLHIVHRDVSPQNILIGYDGQVKLIDFGIAKAATKSQRTQAGILKGKFGYMSPEQVRGLPIDRRSDIFALGVILYEMITGERLFTGESDFSILERVRNAEVISPRQYNPTVPAELERIVLRALTREPADRYQWASELADDLLDFLEHSEIGQGGNLLAGFMRHAFGEEILRERERMLRFGTIDRPPEVPLVSLRPYLPSQPPARTSPSGGDRTMMVVSSASGGTAAPDSATGSAEFESVPITSPMPNPADELYPLAVGDFQDGATRLDPSPPLVSLQALGLTSPPQLARVGPPAPNPRQAAEITDGSNKVPWARGLSPVPPGSASPSAPEETVLTDPPLARHRLHKSAVVWGLGVASALVLAISGAVTLRRAIALSGTLVISARPLAGLVVEVDGQPATADADGDFVLRELSPGPHIVFGKGPTGEKTLPVTVARHGITAIDLLLPALAPARAAEPAPGADSGPSPEVEASLSATAGPTAASDAGELLNAMPSMDLTGPPPARRQRPEAMVGSHDRHRPVGELGKLLISSTESAKVFVDGKPTTRYTPIPGNDALELPSGDHRIHLVSEDGKSADRRVTIKANGIVKLLNVDLQ